MDRGRSYNHHSEHNIKIVQQKLRTSQNKNKATQNLMSRTQNSTKIINSQQANLKITSQKQNQDLIQSIISIIAMASQQKQKQILQALGTQIVKEQKLKSIMNRKDSINQKQQIQGLLNHVKQQQNRQISLLKLQAGKRKLHSLDQQDLREDLLNLYSYVMRCSKKQALVLKSQGVDLIGQIYNKFDQLANQISVLVSEKKHQIIQNNENARSKNLKRVKQAPLIQNIFQNDKKNIQFSKNSGRSQMLQKIVEMQKQNLRLIKQTRKIQQQFQFVVEQKLVLQQKYDAAQQIIKINKQKYLTSLSGLKNKINHLAQQYQAWKAQIQLLVSQLISGSQTIISQQILSKYQELSNTCSRSQELQHSTIQQQYENVIIDKQVQINNLLKIIYKLNQQKGRMQRDLQDLQIKLDKNKQDNTKVKQELYQIKQQLIKVQNTKMQINNIVNQQLVQMHNIIRRISQVSQANNQQLFRNNQITKQKLTNQQQKVQQLQKQLRDHKNWQQLLILSKNKQNQMLDQINIMKANQIRYQESIKQISMHLSDLQNNITIKQHQISCLRMMGNQHQKQKQRLNLQIQSMNQQLNGHHISKFKNLQVVNEKLLKQNAKLYEDIRQQRNKKQQYQKLIQIKEQQLTQNDKQYGQQKVIMQDLNLQIKHMQQKLIKQRIDQQKKQIEKNKHVKILKNLLIQIKCSINEIKKEIKNILNSYIQFIRCQQTQIIEQLLLIASKKDSQIKITHLSLSQKTQMSIKKSKNTLAYNTKYQQIIEFLQSLNIKFDKIDWQNATQTQIIQFLSNATWILINQLKNQKQTKICEQVHIQPQPITLQKQQPLSDSQEADKIDKNANYHQNAQNKIYKCQLYNFELQDITNCSGFVDQIESLKNQLGKSYQQNQILMKQLKIYQQKDIDKIFDF